MSEGRKQPPKRAAAKHPKKTSARRGNPQSASAIRSQSANRVRASDATQSRAQDVPREPRPTPFPIVGIGASAGGLASFESFFAAMPNDDATGMAFVLVQHLAPDHKSVLVDLVRRYTKMQVFEAENGLPVRPHCTYIIPPKHDLKLIDGALYLERHEDRHKPQLTIDRFFYSLARAQRERAICVVMSGTGTDGTLGLREIKGESGLVIVQSPDTTEYDGMPRSAIATGMVDYVLPPAEMPAQLIAYARHAFDPARKPPPARDGLLKKLCVLLRAQTGHDFSQYKETTLVRRIERRMALHQITDPEDYVGYAREHPPEVEALFRDLLIGVTDFFRDPEAFNVLNTRAIPRILANKASGDAVRVWVAGCATGEEAYSIAILLYEHITSSKQAVKIQIFATDIDRWALEQARSGVYPASIASTVSEERLARFFVYDQARGTYRIQKYIRDLLVFSEQDVIKDPPFSKVDLLSCRNLLIYLNANLQRKLIALFNYALVSGGVLFLGTSETTGENAHMFQVQDRKWKIYFQLPGDTHLLRPALPAFVPPLLGSGGRRVSHAPAKHAGEGSLRQVTERALLAHYSQAGVLVNSRGEILHIVGRTGKFLEPADGDAAMNILSMAREGLRRELTVALHNVVARKQMATHTGLKVRANGGFIPANMTIRPVETGGTVLYLVILEELMSRPADETPAESPESQEGRSAELERELRSKEEYLQTTLEEMETTNEELKSTNEEMQSINEEMQSTNEELETSKEELQSVNEELSTVNAELQEKVNDLARANNDMNNLLAGTGVATVFVDHAICIARFTPSATQVINLIPSDIGRPLEHVASNIVGYDRMVEDIRVVLETLTPKEAEVQVKSGAWFLMRIRPYRTMENLIEGAVLTMVDISHRKQAEAMLRASEAQLNSIINQAYAGVSEVDLQGQIQFVNGRFCEMLGYTRQELLDKGLAELTDPEDFARLQARMESLVNGASHIQVDKRYVRKDGSLLSVHERISVIRDEREKRISLLLLSFEPVEAKDDSSEP